jgi:hypothetical protein
MTGLRRRTSTAFLGLALLAACGPGGKDDGPTPRTFALAATGIQADPGAVTDPATPFFAMRPADLADDADVVSIHQDFYGVPWTELAAGIAPPAAWVARMDALRDRYAGRRIFLSLQLAGGPQRTYLADSVVVNDGVPTNKERWNNKRCYDFASEADGAALRTAWTRYVTWIVNEFQPEWVNVGIELNLFAVQCPTAWPGMVETERAGYEAAKAARPGVIAFPSIQLDSLYGRQQCTPRDSCYDANFAKLADLAGDRFAVSLYPQSDSEWKRPDEVPADYLTRAADRAFASPAGVFGSGVPMLVAETGWGSAAARGSWKGTCTTVMDFTEEDTDAWLARVLEAADARSMDLVTWWSDRDFIPAAVSESCTYDATWQPIVDLFRAAGGEDPAAQYLGELTLKVFGTMGIRGADGTPKGAPYSRWKAAQTRPLVAP